MDQSQQEALKQFGKAAEVAAKSIAINLAPFMIAFAELGKQLHASLWYAYIMDGAPYGEDRKGLERWVQETSARMRAEQAASIEEQWQELLARARGWRKKSD